VDDEPNVLEGLRLNSDRIFDLHTAGSGTQALALLEREPPFAVVVSDMRMPEMDGAEFPGRVREHFTDTVRILLTGYADVRAAISAVNNGQIFRILLSQLGCVTLPEVTIENLHFGNDLTPDEAEKVTQASRTAERLLADIPRLEAVRGIPGEPKGSGMNL
jgi:DNA-binding NtrC family response regulator